MAGSVKHILLVKFKDSITAEQQAALIHKGTDMSVENLHQGFTHVFISTFDSPEGRDEYLVHPVHVEFGKEFLATLDNVVVVDFNPTITLKAS